MISVREISPMSTRSHLLVRLRRAEEGTLKARKFLENGERRVPVRGRLAPRQEVGPAGQ